MIKKSTAIVVIIALVALSVGVTFFTTQSLLANDNVMATTVEPAVDSGDKADKAPADNQVTISQDEYDALMNFRTTYSKLDDLKKYISQNFYQSVDEKVLMDGMIRGLFESVDDRYTVYMNEREFLKFNESNAGEYGGLGIYIGPTEDGRVEIISPIEDTPAERAGLLPGDIIVKAEEFDVTAENMEEATYVMKGEPGTDVNVTFYRPSTDETFTLTITRALVKIKVVKTRMLDDQIGYLRFTLFDNKSFDEFQAGMDTLVNDENAKGIVIDIRSNPGGSLKECINIANLFIDDGNIVNIVDRAGEREYYNANPGAYDVPVVFLINGGSASASEILSAAVKDNGVGTLIGETTYGKGVVQTVEDFGDATGFKVTTYEFFTPDQNQIHQVGVAPHIVVEQNPEYTRTSPDEDDFQLQKGIEVLKEKLK